MTQDIQSRQTELEEFDRAANEMWPFIDRELDKERARLVEILISREDEKARGGIQAIDRIKNMRDWLGSELISIKQALSERDA